MAIVNAQTFGKRLCDAVGVNSERCSGLTIEVESGDFVRVIATYTLDDEQGDKVIKLLGERSE
ncbi:hypothetical protein [Pseudoxanthomonas sacheonensis]|uniref:hypothetical protein n=1 Tax=Pseudoxanthomonas sacheonensis TaxID=443615 RepID=UPI0013D013F2|nr:hypothetical protein [Pseudoxanthomonas sacheonensis]KAF1706285.1 hypothetical protein CSC73_16405 [Pseudoxanthomonas sacheonensis]